ncbi:glycerophosphodiester phosphodiesterase protein kinase domain-containing gdpdl2 [Phtheirospermum japonicum]|uniref:Glycerophosphodiester phosphodiesterase protein kinase domain-containing gdpdl2 n=1 Tax=Phtheirospermum japonicum TaxID=374723 RepID=A0A830BNE6_9LAMI|nr:glycerophosphodiester phosphodiesterase protein kinase domain-containing gdpdl2 [Phtheirospermum japonicum]
MNIQRFSLKLVGVALGNLTLPAVSASATLTVTPNLAMFTCLTRSTNSETIQDYFPNYSRRNFSLFDVYYRYPETSSDVPVTDIPSDCVMVQVPINSTRDSTNLLDLLSPEYVIEWNVSEDCYNCHHRGGKCGVTMAALTFTAIIIFLSIRKNYALLKLLGIRKAKTGKELDIELFLKDHGNLAPKRYKYSDLKKMTKSFSENLGKGGYGSVYKGKLPDGRLVAYIYKQLELMDGRLDHGIVNEGASELAKRKLITVGLWCIQTDPKDRPSMSKVVEMLEGKIETLQVPPKPYLSSPPRLALDFSTTSHSM